jgi:tripartite-type tricarboxylate transporter receptor subunit TctC
MLKRAIGVSMTHVPFRGTSDEMAAMIGGHIDLAIDSMTTIWPLARTGEVRPLAVTTPQRVAAAPQLPTIGETLPGFEAVGWQGLFAPAGTPRAIMETIAAAVRHIFLQPSIVTALQDVGGEPYPLSPDEFARFARAERGKWGAVVRDAGVRIE